MPAGDPRRRVGGAHPRVDQVGDPGVGSGCGAICVWIAGMGGTGMGPCLGPAPRPTLPHTSVLLSGVERDPVQRCVWDLNPTPSHTVPHRSIPPSPQEWNEIQFNGVHWQPEEAGAPGEVDPDKSYTFKYPRPDK